jgi:hypothetical protein
VAIVKELAFVYWSNQALCVVINHQWSLVPWIHNKRAFFFSKAHSLKSAIAKGALLSKESGEILDHAQIVSQTVKMRAFNHIWTMTKILKIV